MSKRTYAVLLLGILAAVGLAMLVAEHQGYVLISWKRIRFESTLWVFLGCLVLVYVLLYVLRIIASFILSSLGVVNPWSSRNQRLRLQRSVERGMLEYAQGNWQPALEHLNKAAKRSPQPLPYLLDAARAAQNLHKEQKADALLAIATSKHPQHELAIAMCEAEILLQRQQAPKALQLLQQTYQNHQANKELQIRLSRLAEQQQDWSLLLQLLPVLRKNKRLAQSYVEQLEISAWQGRLEASGNSLEQAQDIWETMPHKLRKESPILLAYCGQLLAHKEAGQAESILRNQLNHKVDVQLLQAYAQLPHQDAQRALKTAENWLQKTPEDSTALYATGLLCLQAQLWGKARDYLQASLKQQPSARVYAELARLLNQMGDHKASQQMLTTSLNNS